MNKEFFQQVFNQNMGFVYKYLGTVPEGESVAHYVTDEFVTAVNNNLVVTTVTELPQFNTIVLYNYSDTDTVSSPKFELITDLVPPIAPTPPEQPSEEPVQGQ